MTPRQRLLVVELHHLGDAVLSLPFINAAAASFDVTVLCRPGAGAIYEMAIQPPEVIEWDPPWTGGAWPSAPSLLRQLRREKFAAAACGWADTRAHLLMKLAGARRRAGLPMNDRNYYGVNIAWRRRQLRRGRCLGTAASLVTGGPLLTDPVQRRSYLQHHLDDWAQVGEALGVTVSPSPPWLQPARPPSGESLAALLRDAREERQKVWLIHAGGRLPTKRWALDRFEAVIERVFKPRGIPLVLVQPPGEPVPRDMGARAVVVTPEDVTALAGLVGAIDAVLCNDSLISHLAAALGKKVVAIFGSGEPAWFAPHGVSSRVVRENICPYHPCIDRCQMPSTVCLEAVAVENVAAAVEAMIRP